MVRRSAAERRPVSSIDEGTCRMDDTAKLPNVILGAFLLADSVIFPLKIREIPIPIEREKVHDKPFRILAAASAR
jgi:hypothetical protein